MKRTSLLSLSRCYTVKATYRSILFLIVRECCERHCRRILQAVEDGYTESSLGLHANQFLPDSGFFRLTISLALALKKVFIIGEGENLFTTGHPPSSHVFIG